MIHSQKSSGFQGEITIPGDKSISHRAIMLGALADGISEIHNSSLGNDCMSTIHCFQKMNIEITLHENHLLIHGKGLHGLSQAPGSLYVGNSGTTARLLSGILSGQDFSSILLGDHSLNTRPMERIITPLTLMGSTISSVNHNGCAPLSIHPSALHGIHYQSKIASAQVKSALLLAGLYANEPTSFTEPFSSRNHTELMLSDFGCSVQTTEHTTTLCPITQLQRTNLSIPGDISSAAYLIAGALLLPHSELLIKDVGINPTRSGFLNICKQMGGDITIINTTIKNQEPRADLLVCSSSLHGIVIEGSVIPTLIDELTIIAIMAAFASGTTTIKDASELRVKESDRIQTISQNLLAMGGSITTSEDGMTIHGGIPLHGAYINSQKDHRIAMAFTIAALAAEGSSTISDSACVKVSYPDFYETLSSLL